MKSFYTNVQVWGGKILYRGVENGRKIKKKIDYQPTLFIKSNKPTEFKTIHNQFVSTINPGSIKDCRDFVKQYENVDGFEIYGNQKYEYVFSLQSFYFYQILHNFDLIQSVEMHHQ